MTTRYFKDGQMKLELVSGIEEIGQLAVQKVNLFFGTWFDDPQVGVPWLQTILGINNQQTALSYLLTSLSNELLTLPGVDNFSFTQISFDPTTRKITMTLAITAGEETIEEDINYGLPTT